jgi:hypothetical protein
MWTVLAGIVAINVYAYWIHHGHPLLLRIKSWWDNLLIIPIQKKEPANDGKTDNGNTNNGKVYDGQATNGKEGMCNGRDKCDPDALTDAIQRHPGNGPAAVTETFVAIGAKPSTTALAPF